MDIKATPYSSLKLFAHADKLQSLKRGERTAPLYVRIKPTNRCNQRCNYCCYADSTLAFVEGVKETDQIPWEKMQEIIGDLASMGVKALTFSGGGEPLVYPHINEAMRLVLDKGIDLSLITNGHLLRGETAELSLGAKWVRVSFDSATAETYSKIRGISTEAFGQVCANIERFAARKPQDCELGINFVVNHQNSAEVYQAAVLLKKLGVQHIKYTARITENPEEYHRSFRASVVEQIRQASTELIDSSFSVINKYEEDFALSTVCRRTYSTCIIKEVSTVIAADSKVYFCHDKAYVESGCVGDLKERSFKELWFSPEVETRFKNFDAKEECCHHCVYDDRNVLMNSFFSLKDGNINFI